MGQTLITPPHPGSSLMLMLLVWQYIQGYFGQQVIHLILFHRTLIVRLSGQETLLNWGMPIARVGIHGLCNWSGCWETPVQSKLHLASWRVQHNLQKVIPVVKSDSFSHRFLPVSEDNEEGTNDNAASTYTNAYNDTCLALFTHDIRDLGICEQGTPALVVSLWLIIKVALS